jgi:hypothetical protein
MSQSLILIELGERKKREREREKWLGAFFPRARHILLAVLCSIFMALGAIKG